MIARLRRRRIETSAQDLSAVQLRSLEPAEWASILSGAPDEVARWVGSAAQYGFAAARVTFGQMLLDGRFVRRDRAAAFKWFSRAAGLGSTDGINMVGRCYELGWGVPVDHARAFEFYRKAAGRSHVWGQYNLASMLLYGEGIERDPKLALGFYMQAAEQGLANAMGMVGRFHEEGWTVPADVSVALSWYRRAAAGGDFWSQFNLARMLAGAGRKDEALAWLRKSIEGGTANFLHIVAADLRDHPDSAFQGVAAQALERYEARAESPVSCAVGVGGRHAPRERRRGAAWRRFADLLRGSVARAAVPMLAAVVLIASGVRMAAQEPPRSPEVLHVELNRLEAVQGDSCRAYLLIQNNGSEAFKSLKLDLFALDSEGVAAKRVAVELGPVPAEKTLIKLFDFAGLPCGRFGRVLLNDVLTCATAAGPRDGCMAAIRSSSKTVPFIR